MSDDILIRIPGQSRNTMLGKVLFVVLLASVWGRFVAKAEMTRYQEFVKASESEVAAILDEYEAKRREEPDSTLGTIVLLLVAFGVLYATYELFGPLLGTGVGSVLDRVQAWRIRGFDEPGDVTRQ
jgi:hypothetical protein